MKIKPLEIVGISENMMGRKRKDGKPDQRYTRGMLMIQESINEISGISIAARALGKIGGTATKKKLGIEHFKRISKLGVKARGKM